MGYRHTRSSSGGCNVAVACVPVSAPKCGNVEDQPTSRAGVIDTRCRARVSPGSAPATWNGPLTGFRNGYRQTWLGRSAMPRTPPPKQSSVITRITWPGLTSITGLTPPKV